MKKVIFLCTGNSCRSIMAEFILSHFGKNKYYAYSAGSKPIGTVNPNALYILSINNIPTNNHGSKSWDSFKGNQFDYIVTVCNNAANETCPIYPGNSTKLHWDIPDPATVIGNHEIIKKEFQKVYELIKKNITKEFLK